MQIEITKVSPVYQDGKWSKLDINYIRDGKPDQRTLVAIGGTKQVVELLKDAAANSVWDIDLKKSTDGKFWNWERAVPATGAAKPSTTSTPKSTYETAEERAVKQVYIVRQSSIANAITLHGTGAKLDTVLKTATEFEKFVFNGHTGPATFPE